MLKINKNTSKLIVEILLLTGIVLIGAFFRFYGINWDENFHLHPDERFLTMVETSLAPVESFKEYFNTATSTLNPHNILDASGNSVFPFFVYGTFPILLIRYFAEWLGMTGYNEVQLIGRYWSGIFDIGTILVVFLIARELFHKKWLPYLAAFFYTCAILPIQISHFFIVDNFATFFSALALLYAVRVQKYEEQEVTDRQDRNPFFTDWKGLKNFAFFGAALGLAGASKINTLVLAALLPIAVLLKDDRLLQNLSSPKWKIRLRNLVLAGFISFIFFRIFQPYAFSGPGFFGILPNSKWIANLRELSFLSSGDSNYPPSIQWARRSFLFPIKNLVIWGLGLPVGILSVAGLLWMAVKFIKGQEKRFTLLWIFTFFYLVWQALRWNPTMRYFLILYPVLAILASWVVEQAINAMARIKKPRFVNIGIGVLLGFLIIAAVLVSFSFLNIYRQPMTRIAASDWIYRNIPGAVNLEMVDDTENDFIQPLPYPNFTRLDSGESITFEFSPVIDGQINSIRFDHIVNPDLTESESSINLVISTIPSGEVLFSRTIQNSFIRVGDSKGVPLDVNLETPLNVLEGNQYQFILSVIPLDISLQFFGNIQLEITSDDLDFSQPVFEFTRILTPEREYESIFSPIDDSFLKGIEFFRWLSLGNKNPIEVSVDLTDTNSGNQILTKTFFINPQESLDLRGSPVFLEFENPVKLGKEGSYSLRIKLLNENAKVAINGSKAVRETDWDDGLPLYMYGFNPYDSYEGIYASDLNFQMYWDDDANKLQRFLQGLYQADYFIITSNRQWGSVTQIPEKYPLTTYFYRNLIGCQADDVQWCYRVAESGKFEGLLGFDLRQTFHVNPAIFGWQFNSQFAEEAFTVYDHPKVLIFEKSSEFNFHSIVDQLTTVDLDQVLNISIKESEQRPGLLTLYPSQLNRLKESGTWSRMFDYRSLLNSNQFLGVTAWYLFITFLGWINYPLVRTAFTGLSDKGFPLAKLTGLVVWAWIAWMGSSSGIPFTRSFIFISLLIVAGINLAILLKNRSLFNSEFREQRRYFVTVELISLGLFLFFLLIRLGNPDLWHPFKGGEKPMDFAYLNAVIKSKEFPPYDPWYAGGYINYYYFGFLLAGIIVKLLGIIPSIAYNLILPTFFTFTGMAAFSLGWNLIISRDNNQSKKTEVIVNHPYFWGIIAVVFVLIIGNLGTISMFFQGIFKIGMEGAQTVGFGLIDKPVFLFKGLVRFIQGANFSFYPGDWYWIPSRAIPRTVITEFPYFTFLYGDPHAHLFAYPLTLVILGWCLSLVFGKFNFNNNLEFIGTILTGALLIGVLRPTNTWDYPVYLAFGCVSLIYASIKYGRAPTRFLPGVNDPVKKILFSILLVVTLAGLSLVLFAPFDRWYGQAYSSIDFWKGDKTPFWAYFIHWGFFLFLLISWIFYNIWKWMNRTPLASLDPYYRRRKAVYLAILGLVFINVMFLIYGVQVSVVAIPILAVLLIFLLLDRAANDTRKFIIFLLLTGIGLTLMVELISLSGDIGRMNTVFKFYLQAWTLFAVAGVYLLADLFTKSPGEKRLVEYSGWKIWLGLFSFSVLLFPLMASMDKIHDRMNDLTPITLDGMDYMKYSSYSENGILMDLSQDYYAIRWMQENVSGTPVIAEANIPEYRWGNRFSIYTGLPSVVGWNWHQRQQRAINPGEWIFNRVEDITDFYTTTDIQAAKDFLNQYEVEYVILGQLEKAVYPPEGLMKFEEFSGKLWDVVYEAADTKIFKVKG